MDFSRFVCKIGNWFPERDGNPYADRDHVLLDERGKRNIRKFVCRLYEAGSTVVGVTIDIKRDFFAVHAYEYFEVFDKVVEIAEQHFVRDACYEQFQYFFISYDFLYIRLL